VAALGGSVGGLLLLAGESEGLAIDFTVADGTGSVAVRDVSTPANNKNNAAVSAFLTNSSASVKWVLGSNGFYSAAAAGIAFEYEPSTGGYYGLVEALAATNVVLWSRDLTNAAWTKSNVTATKDQAGIDGVANSATRLAATAGNGTCLQAITLASSSRGQSAFVKRVVGSGVVEMTTDGGSTWTAVAVTASWVRVSIPIQVVTNPSVGFRIVTSGDEIAVDMVQNEVCIAVSTSAPSTATSPIPTTTVAVARAADVWTSASSSFPIGTIFTNFIDYSLAVNATDGYVFGLSDNTDNNFGGPRIGTSQYTVLASGAGQMAIAISGAPTAGRRQITARAKLNDSAATINGAANVADTVCTVPVVDRLCFGRHRAAGTVPVNNPLKLRRFVHVPRGVSDADLPNWRYL
jgi:hypothetical protein